ncbi:hypothetical protein FOA52_013012 [Chlamydomonas sp. UWO 241]|nr:hypothetical protein FOA52_013012 [Chlamydomonas sp. UWO 241]
MQAPVVAYVAAEEVDDTLGERVISTALIFAELWHHHLDADDKKALRLVSRSICALANESVEELRAEGTFEQIASALAVLPSLTSLTMDYSTESLPELSAVPLTRLTRLELWIQAIMDGNDDDDDDFGVSVPALSSTAAAGLRELHERDKRGAAPGVC